MLVLPYLLGSHVHLTIIFNTFVFCQIFNEFNARSIGDDLNVFKGLYRNPIFGAIILFTVGAQYLLVEHGGEWVRTKPLSFLQYYQCIILGGLSITLGGLMRFVPVKESDKDFAPMSEITAKLQRESPKPKKQAATNTPSFYVWVFTAGLFPALVIHEFGAKWFARMGSS